MRTPAVHHSEFSLSGSQGEGDFGYRVTEWTHPHFGTWSQKTIDLGYVKVEQNQSRFRERIAVSYDNDVSGVVHHCISVQGSMAAHVPDHKLDARLDSMKYHNMYLSDSRYHLSIDREVVNVHIEIDKDYYCRLLPQNEAWADAIREKIVQHQVYYPGEFPLTPAMIQSLHTLFSSPLSGPLKKMLAEAKVQELLALQLFHFSDRAPQLPARDRDLMHAIRSYLDTHFLEEHTLKGICQQFGVNEFKLKRGFKQTFQTTVFDYLWNKKMEHAHSLLAERQMRILEVANLVGYQYTNHFSTAFKKKFGYSPSALTE
ncbi:MAG: helix-turn-helix transcriptional regulator [Cyclobacteriaceae bacterium]|nr:helix-turn-helix transcriptional regulator [Cyclobacteriaceae bacterium]